jgi:hypothetical protein
VKREAVNAWIRSGRSFDAVIDFDAAVRDPDHPTRIRADYDVGDHLHPNDAGYRAMGDAVDLKLFEWRRTLAIRDEARPTDRRKVPLDALHACRKGPLARRVSWSVVYRSADEHGRGPRFLLHDLRCSLRADAVEA